MSGIFRDGILIDVNVRLWTAEVALTAEDLGLDETKVVEAIKLGRKSLVPPDVIKEFRKIESAARYIVDSSGFRFAVGGATFVPRRRAVKALPKLEECRAQYNALIENLLNRLPEYKEQMIPVYRRAAEEAWDNLTPTGVQEFSIEDMDSRKREFVERFLRRIEALYPPVEKLRGKFSLTWDVYELTLDMNKVNDGRLVEDVRHEEAVQEAEDARKAEETARRQIGIEEYQRQTQERIGGFVDEVVRSMRQQTVDMCGRISQNIKDGKVITERTLNSIREYIDRFKDLNFVGDKTIEEQLESLRKDFLAVFPAEQVREDSELREELQRRITVIAETASNLTDVNEISGEYNRQINWRKPA